MGFRRPAGRPGVTRRAGGFRLPSRSPASSTRGAAHRGSWRSRPRCSPPTSSLWNSVLCVPDPGPPRNPPLGGLLPSLRTDSEDPPGRVGAPIRVGAPPPGTTLRAHPTLTPIAAGPASSCPRTPASDRLHGVDRQGNPPPSCDPPSGAASYRRSYTTAPALITTRTFRVVVMSLAGLPATSTRSEVVPLATRSPPCRASHPFRGEDVTYPSTKSRSTASELRRPASPKPLPPALSTTTL